MLEERNILREQARRFAEATFAIADLRQRRHTADLRAATRRTWKALGGVGWPGMTLGEAFGGTGMGFAGLGIACEELGRRLAPTPLVPSAIAAHMIENGGREAAKQKILPAIASGDALAVPALDEAARFDPRHVGTRAEPEGGGFRLSGRKLLVKDAPAADWFVVSARQAAVGVSLFIVEAGAPGVSRQDAVLLDSSFASTLVFDGVEVRAEAELGTRAGSWTLLEDAIAAGVVCLCAEMLGAAEQAFRMTLDYLKEREQFGVRIGSFQALQHRAARWYGEIELLRSLVARAIDAIDAGAPDVAKLASACKARASDTLMLSGEEGVQMHGGIGMTDEHDIGFYLKRARVAQQWLGDAAYHRDRFASLSGY